MLRTPPDILITTPESLFLLLTSQARETLRGVETVILDEVHAVAGTKRGAHLALSLERLERLVDAAVPAHRPLGHAAAARGDRPLRRRPGRAIELVDAGVRKELDLEVVVPVEDMRELGVDGRARPCPSLADGVEMGVGVERVEPLDLAVDLPRAPRARPSAPLDDRLRQQPPPRRAARAPAQRARRARSSRARTTARWRASSGSSIEELLKAGRIPCLVATSSLELGIDMGAVDLVIQVESPKSVARGLQRVGRAGHELGSVSKGRIFPKFRADLLESAVVAQRDARGRDRGDADPAQPARRARAADRRDLRRRGDRGRRAPRARPRRAIRSPSSRARSSRTCSTCSPGRYPSDEFAELRPRIVWDRTAGVDPRPNGRAAARGHERGHDPRPRPLRRLPGRRRRPRRRARRGDGLRGARRARRSCSAPRPGGSRRSRATACSSRRRRASRARSRSGRARASAGRTSSARRSARRARARRARRRRGDSSGCADEYHLDARAARNLLTFLREQEAATGVVPSDRTIVVERFRDEIGDWRVCILTPFGGRVHAPWAMALRARLRDSLGLEVQSLWSDDGIALHFPDADAPPADRRPARSTRTRSRSSSSASSAQTRALRRALPRERGARAAHPAPPAGPADAALAAAAEGAEPAPGRAPLRLVPDRARDLPRVPAGRLRPAGAARDPARDLQTRELDLVEVETPSASPFAASLLFDYVATYMYEDDTPPAERRAQALSLDRDLLRELLGQEELRDLLDPDALAEVERSLRRRRRATPTSCTTCSAARGDLRRRRVRRGFAETARRASGARFASGSAARSG